jgi:hypothetical protein
MKENKGYYRELKKMRTYIDDVMIKLKISKTGIPINQLVLLVLRKYEIGELSILKYITLLEISEEIEITNDVIFPCKKEDTKKE